MEHGTYGRIFALFGYDISGRPEAVLHLLPELAKKSEGRIISMVCLGHDFFIDYWHCDPILPVRRPVRRWHLYEIKRESPGYFLHHLVRHTAPQSVEENEIIWYPERSREALEQLKIAHAWLDDSDARPQ
jgi:hypothetical protein